MKKVKQYLPWIIAGLIFIGFYVIGRLVPEETIKSLIVNSGSFGVVVFILLTLATYVFAPISGSPLLYAGFYAFGREVILYTSIAVIISSVINFLIAKKWGKAVIVKLAGQDSLDKLDKLALNYGLVSLFIFRIFLHSFHDVVSYAFGLTLIKFKQYLVVSTLGMIPGIIFWYLVSTYTNNPLTFTLLTHFSAYALLLVYIAWKSIIKKKKLDKVGPLDVTNP
jgi:uncharacterized membrane protein YdjX (TVP38/TMEM64 family)